MGVNQFVALGPFTAQVNVTCRVHETSGLNLGS